MIPKTRGSIWEVRWGHRTLENRSFWKSFFVLFGVTSPQKSWGVPPPSLGRGDLAHDLRKARDAGLMTSYEPELRELEIKDAEAVAARTATEHAQQAEGLMQQVRALDRMPKENHDPKECRLASPLLLPRKT